MVKNATPEPIELGIYDCMPAEQYHAIDACSSTRLNALKRSASHCLQIIHDPIDSDALLLGSATHCAILEGESFGRRYAYGPDVDGRTKDGKAAKADAEIIAARDGKRLLPAKFREQIDGMAGEVRLHPAASALIAQIRFAERTILWRDAEHNNLLCRARLDGWCPDIGTIVDVKTTTDASPEAFAASAWKWGYWRQAAFYRRAAAAVGLEARNSVIIAVEKEAPFAVGVYRLHPDAIRAAAWELEELIEHYEECTRTDQWLGYSSEVEDLDMPAWAKARAEKGLVEA